jgi:superfamily I DNA/RNA helicase
LNEVALVAAADDLDDESGTVSLMTLHTAKGLEFPIVFLAGLEEGLLPHKRVVEEGSEIDEERRLCYVGITRARDQLFMTRAKNRIRYGKPVPRLQSRFLEEIPEGLVVKTDLSGTPDMDSPGAQEAHETKVKDFLAGIRAQLLTSAGKGTTPARR